MFLRKVVTMNNKMVNEINLIEKGMDLYNKINELFSMNFNEINFTNKEYNNFKKIIVEKIDSEMSFDKFSIELFMSIIQMRIKQMTLINEEIEFLSKIIKTNKDEFKKLGGEFGIDIMVDIIVNSTNIENLMRNIKTSIEREIFFERIPRNEYEVDKFNWLKNYIFRD